MIGIHHPPGILLFKFRPGQARPSIFPIRVTSPVVLLLLFFAAQTILLTRTQTFSVLVSMLVTFPSLVSWKRDFWLLVCR